MKKPADTITVTSEETALVTSVDYATPNMRHCGRATASAPPSPVNYSLQSDRTPDEPTVRASPPKNQLVLFTASRSGKTAAAAKSLQSCPTVCDPIDISPPGSPVPGILQARTLEWVAISFSNA